MYSFETRPSRFPYRQGPSLHRHPLDHSIAPPLPAELIKHILQLAVEDDGFMGNFEGNPHFTYPVLRNASLVSKAWSGPACEILWRRMELRSGKAADAVVGSPALGRYRTEEVTLGMTLSDCKSTLTEVLSALVGIKSLEVGHCVGTVTTDFLYIPSLQNLSSLLLRGPIIETSTRPLNFTLPQHLLHLTFSARFDCINTATSLITGSARTIRSLDLQHLDQEYLGQRFRLRDNHPVPLPNLVTFKFNETSKEYGFSTFPHASKLKNLAITAWEPVEVQTTLSKLALPLRSLELTSITRSYQPEHYPIDEMSGPMCQVLEEALRVSVGLRALEVLYVGWTDRYLARFPEGKALTLTMKKRGVRMEGNPADDD
ncbi:hypothetical protein P7C70_g2210, partial [Phenoliferia sp. Uapishka_3]